MKLEKNRLIHDLLRDRNAETRREATLLAGRRFLRRKRYKRVMSRCFGVAVIIMMAAMVVHLGTTPHQRPFSANPTLIPTVHYLTDDQLLALFPNTPVGLATVGDKKVLLFPRPGDRERFVGQF
jgi:hypothetical protein